MIPKFFFARQTRFDFIDHNTTKDMIMTIVYKGFALYKVYKGIF